MDFNSNADEIKYYIKELLNKGEEQTTQEIICYVKNKSKKEFTNGMLSGAINDLIDRERTQYRRVRRGIYAKVPSGESELNSDDEFDLIIKNAILDIEKAKKMDIELLTPGSLEKMKTKSNRIIQTLYSLLENN